MGNRVTKELHVPKKLHGAIFNDGWFGTGAAWNADESRVAYVAEVSSSNVFSPLLSPLVPYLCLHKFPLSVQQSRC